MGTLIENPGWKGVRHFDADAVLSGGPDCPDNLPLQDLVDRTGYLKAEIEGAQAGQGDHAAAADPHVQYAMKLNPVLTAPTVMAAPEAGDNSLKLVPSSWVVTAIATAFANMVGAAPAALDTFYELATAIANDANFAATITNALALKAPLASPAFTGSPTAPTPADLSVALEVVNAAFLAKRAGSQGAISGDRSRAINGSCQVVNVASVAVPSSGNTVYGGPELFPCGNNGAGGQFTQSPGSLTFGGLTLPTVRQTVNTPPTSIAAANNWVGLAHRFEGYNVFDLKGKPVALSFVFNTNVSGTYSVSLRDGSVGQSYVTTIVAVANTPLQVTIPVAAVPAGASLPNTNAVGLYLAIGALNTATYQAATLNQWQAGNFLTAAGAINWGATAGNFIELTNLQLEEGSVATPFIRRPYAKELELTERYFEKSYDGTEVPNGSRVGMHASGIQSGYLLHAPRVRFRVPKRTVPTIILFSETGVSGQVTEYDAGSVITAHRAGGAVYPSNAGFEVQSATGNFNNAIGYNTRFNWQANSRL